MARNEISTTFSASAPAAPAPLLLCAAGVPDATCTNSTSAFCHLVNSTGVICKYSLKVGATVCRGFAGSCDVQEVCSGQSPDCPADAFQPNTTVCQPASGSIPSLFCSGSDPNCPPYGSSTNCSAQAVPACVNATSGEHVCSAAALQVVRQHSSCNGACEGGCNSK